MCIRLFSLTLHAYYRYLVPTCPSYYRYIAATLPTVFFEIGSDFDAQTDQSRVYSLFPLSALLQFSLYIFDSLDLNS